MKKIWRFLTKQRTTRLEAISVSYLTFLIGFVLVIYCYAVQPTNMLLLLTASVSLFWVIGSIVYLLLPEALIGTVEKHMHPAWVPVIAVSFIVGAICTIALGTTLYEFTTVNLSDRRWIYVIGAGIVLLLWMISRYRRSMIINSATTKEQLERLLALDGFENIALQKQIMRRIFMMYHLRKTRENFSLSVIAQQDDELLLESLRLYHDIYIPYKPTVLNMKEENRYGVTILAKLGKQLPIASLDQTLCRSIEYFLNCTICSHEFGKYALLHTKIRQEKGKGPISALLTYMEMTQYVHVNFDAHMKYVRLCRQRAEANAYAGVIELNEVIGGGCVIEYAQYHKASHNPYIDDLLMSELLSYFIGNNATRQYISDEEIRLLIKNIGALEYFARQDNLIRSNFRETLLLDKAYETICEGITYRTYAALQEQFLKNLEGKDYPYFTAHLQKFAGEEAKKKKNNFLERVA